MSPEAALAAAARERIPDSCVPLLRHEVRAVGIDRIIAEVRGRQATSAG